MSFFDKDSLATRDVGLWFTASFDSDCAECLSRIYEGDQARYANGEVVCEICGDENYVSKAEVKPAVCGKCFVQLSAIEQRRGLQIHEEC